MPNPNEVATLIVNGQKFEDWKTVVVEQRYADANPIFNFTCTEKQPAPLVAALRALKPGDDCTILLGGKLAVTGEITIRQVGYGEDDHGVQLIGKGRSHLAAKSSVDPTKSNFDGYTWSQIARSALGQCGVKLETKGKLSQLPFENCQAQPGETIWAFLERLARNRGIVMGSNHIGSILGLGDHEMIVSDQLVEGDNIKRATCIFSNEFVHKRYLVSGQTNGNDSRWGTAASEIDAQIGGSLQLPSLSYTPMEQNGTVEEAQLRARFEAQWHQATEVEAQVIVQGWHRRGGDLWRAGDAAWVRSPMLPLDTALAIKQATFTQTDESGTLTTLDLVLPWFLNGRVDISLGAQPVPARPGLAAPTPEGGT